MAENRVRLVHDTVGGEQRRNRDYHGFELIVIGVLFILGALGGFSLKEYSTAFLVLIIGVVLVFFGNKMRESGRPPEDGVRIRFD